MINSQITNHPTPRPLYIIPIHHDIYKYYQAYNFILRRWIADDFDGFGFRIDIVLPGTTSTKHSRVISRDSSDIYNKFQPCLINCRKTTWNAIDQRTR